MDHKCVPIKKKHILFWKNPKQTFWKAYIHKHGFKIIPIVNQKGMKRRQKHRRKEKGQEILRRLVEWKKHHEIDWQKVINTAMELHAKDLKRRQRKQRLSLTRFQTRRKEYNTKPSMNNSMNQGYSINLLKFTCGDCTASTETSLTWSWDSYY